MNDSVQKRTPWSYITASTGATRRANEVIAAGVWLKEIDTGLFTLRASGDAAVLNKALEQHLGLTLPERLSFNQRDDHALYWMTPDEWLLSCPYKSLVQLEADLQSAVKTHHVALVDVSSAYCQFSLGGERAIDLLKKSTGYDVHPRNLPIGKVVNTTFAKTQVTLAATDQQTYRLLVRRSFADYLWLWLQRSSKDHGLEVKTA